MSHTLKMRDNPRRWTSQFAPHPPFDKKGFQRKIDEIVGPDTIRIVWGAEEEIEQAGGVSRLGVATEIVKVGKHQTRVKGIAGTVRIRRWILEQYHAPEILGIENMFVRMPGAGGLYVPPELAAMKQGGLWKPFNYIGDHSKCPVSICRSTDYFCFGDYAEPSEFDLENLRQQTREKERGEHQLIIEDSFDSDYEN